VDLLADVSIDCLPINLLWLTLETDAADLDSSPVEPIHVNKVPFNIDV
jgi:hypothetical protein